MRKTAKNTTYHAYRKDIGRNISHGKKRFFSILVITILGVMMFSGLQASCQDLRISADQFFDAQKLHDLMVRSTLGLTDEDVERLQAFARYPDEIDEAIVDSTYVDSIQ